MRTKKDDTLSAPSSSTLSGKRPKRSKFVSPEQVREQIQNVLAGKKVSSIEELAKEVGLSPKRVGEYVDIPPYLAPYLWRPELDEAIDRGDSLSEMSAAKGILQSGIHRYIIDSGQLAFWKGKKKERKERHILLEKDRRQALEQIAGQIYNLVTRKATEQGWAQEKALEYCRNHQQGQSGKNLIPFETIIKAFTVYEEARQQGEKVGLVELARRAGVSGAPTIGRIYHSVDVPPFYGNQERNILSSVEKAALERALSLDMTSADIGYFLGIPSYLCGNWRTNRGIRRTGKQFLYQLHPQEKTSLNIKRKLTNRLASQIYEAADLGFTPIETAQLLDTHEKVVAYAQEHRNNISGIIIPALKVMFPEKKQETPYRTSK
ncbi:MAG TPA: hypothetical protein VJB06_02110 [archaeon]|nr:hypothetical protein [archaeon]